MKPCEPEQALATIHQALGLKIEPPVPSTPSPGRGDPIPFLIDTVFDKGKELETLSARLAALLEFGLGLVATCSLEALLEKGAEGARQIIGANYSGVGILEADGKRVRCSRLAGVEPQLLASLGEDKFEGAVFQEVVSERRSRRISIPRGQGNPPDLPADHPPIQKSAGARKTGFTSWWKLHQRA